MSVKPLLDRDALNAWIREEIDRAIAFHAATNGTGHQFGDDCDGWVALTAALQLMHDDVHELLEQARPMPTREQIEDAVTAAWLDPNTSSELIVAAVLALLAQYETT